MQETSTSEILAILVSYHYLLQYILFITVTVYFIDYDLNFFIDTTFGTKAPSKTEMEKGEITLWNGKIPKYGCVKGEGVHWRRECIIRQGETNSGGL